MVSGYKILYHHPALSVTPPYQGGSYWEAQVGTGVTPCGALLPQEEVRGRYADIILTVGDFPKLHKKRDALTSSIPPNTWRARSDFLL